VLNNLALRRIHDSVRHIIKDLSSESHLEHPPEGGKDKHDELLLDINVDGSRYLLIRMAGVASSMVLLSPREQEIVRMVAAGYPNKVIAGVLDISSWTVSTHLRRIFAKCGVTSRAAMVAQLLKEGSIWNGAMPEGRPLAGCATTAEAMAGGGIADAG